MSIEICRGSAAKKKRCGQQGMTARVSAQKSTKPANKVLQTTSGGYSGGDEECFAVKHPETGSAGIVATRLTRNDIVVAQLRVVAGRRLGVSSRRLTNSIT